MRWGLWLAYCCAAHAATLESLPSLAVPLAFVQERTFDGSPRYRTPLQEWAVTCRAISLITIGATQLGLLRPESPAEFVGANRACRIDPGEPLEAWAGLHRGAVEEPRPMYRRLTLRNVYAGMDVVYQTSGAGRMTMTWQLQAAMILPAVRLRNPALAPRQQDWRRWLPDAPRRVLQDGRELRAYVTADRGGEQDDWNWSLRLEGADALRPVTIEFDLPEQLSSAFSGSVAQMQEDAAGNLILGGITTRAFGGTRGCYFRVGVNELCRNVLVAKFSAEGRFRFLAVLSGDGHDGLGKLQVDRSGNVYVVGSASFNFPSTPGALRQVGGLDHFAVKLHGETGAVIHAARFGEPDEDRLTGSAVDDAGNVFLGAFHGTPFGGSIFPRVGCAKLSKLAPDFSSLAVDECVGGDLTGLVPDAAGGVWAVQARLDPSAITPDAPHREPTPMALLHFSAQGRVDFATYVPRINSVARVSPAAGGGLLLAGEAELARFHPSGRFFDFLPRPAGGLLHLGADASVMTYSFERFEPDAEAILRVPCPSGQSLIRTAPEGGPVTLRTFLPYRILTVYGLADGRFLLPTETGRMARLDVLAPAVPRYACFSGDIQPGRETTLIGRDLVPADGRVQVRMDGLPAAVVSSTRDTITVRVPAELKRDAFGGYRPELVIEHAGAVFYRGPLVPE